MADRGLLSKERVVFDTSCLACVSGRHGGYVCAARDSDSVIRIERDRHLRAAPAAAASPPAAVLLLQRAAAGPGTEYPLGGGERGAPPPAGTGPAVRGATTAPRGRLQGAPPGPQSPAVLLETF
jgi:hypothetical protein